jgi:hypothetical protein
MESNKNNERSSITLDALLTKKELSELKSFFKKKDLKAVRQYLNEPERKKQLEEKGVVSDYLYYFLELNHPKIFI